MCPPWTDRGRSRSIPWGVISGSALAVCVSKTSTIALIFLLSNSGCAYRIGSNLVHGMLEEASGQGQGEGVDEVGNQVLERALLAELGHQLGTGLSSGAMEISEEQRAELERTVDSLLAVAARRTGKGLRTEVSPELRDLVHQAIVQTLADGLREDIGPSAEAVVERMVREATTTLRDELAMEETRVTISDLLRDSIYFALREGHGGSPSIGESLEFTLEENVLDPLANTVGGIAEGVAYNVNASAQRTEQLLQFIIGGLMFVLLISFSAFWIRGRQHRMVVQTRDQAQARLRNFEGVLSGLDDATRDLFGENFRDEDPSPAPGEPLS